MALSNFNCNFVEGKVYRTKKKQEGDDERKALAELRSILNIKGRRACGCDAQVHSMLANCQLCGRIYCTVEGSGKCFCCGNLILSRDQRDRLHKYIDLLHQAPTTSSQGAKPANASRTRIIDNQIDHLTIDNKRHLREEEKQRLKNELDELQAKRYQRKMVLELDIDNSQAVTYSMPEVDDYEAELKRLQICHQSLEENSSATLAELVEKEFKNNQMLEYVGPNLLVKPKQSSKSTDTKTKKQPSQKQQKKPSPQPAQQPIQQPILHPTGQQPKNKQHSNKSRNKSGKSSKSDKPISMG